MDNRHDPRGHVRNVYKDGTVGRPMTRQQAEIASAAFKRLCDKPTLYRLHVYPAEAIR